MSVVTFDSCAWCPPADHSGREEGGPLSASWNPSPRAVSRGAEAMRGLVATVACSWAVG